MSEYKTCTKCSQTKLVTEFYKLNGKRNSQCGACRRKYWADNREKMNASSRRSYQKNKNSKLEWQKKYAQENPETVKATKKRYLDNNPEKRKASVRNYKLRNSETIKEKSKVYYQNNKEMYFFWASKRRERIRSPYKITSKEIIRLRNRSCFYCGSKNEIHIDHVLPVSRGGQHRIGNLVPACKACNSSKGSKFLMEWRKTLYND